MPTQTAFLPAERLSLSEILVQTGEIGESSVLNAMLDTAPGMIALLNPQRQIVICNDACAKAGGLARKEDALGMRPGELLQCVHAAALPGGCGTSALCPHCGLAQAIVTGQQGGDHSGECLMRRHGCDGDSAAEYAVEVKPLTRLGSGWQSCSISDISDEKRREALERIFFHDIMNRAGGVQSLSHLLADPNTLPEKRIRFIQMLKACSGALV
jgi:PAS domain-containing protein